MPRQSVRLARAARRPIISPRMRILITSDLHYDVVRSGEPTREMARDVLRIDGDALVLLGDSAGRDLSVLRQCLRLFAGFGGRKLLVPGNHCLWCNPGETSIQRYENLLPALAAEEGFHMLDRGPVVLDSRVGLAGSIGWYDYSLREDYLNIPEAFYRAKVSPGAAARLEEHEALFDAHRHTLDERSLDIIARWMDGTHAKLGMSDEQFLDRLIARLDQQLLDLSATVERIVVFLHHLPFAELVPRDRPDRFAFAAAFMGSRRLGELLREYPKISDVYCGHSHWPMRVWVGGMNVVSVGSTYKEKHMEVLEIPGPDGSGV